MVINGEEFRQMNNQWWVIVHAIYVNIIIITLVLWYIIDWHSLYRIKYKILNTHQNAFLLSFKFLWLVAESGKLSR